MHMQYFTVVKHLDVMVASHLLCLGTHIVLWDRYPAKVYSCCDTDLCVSHPNG
jgi:hypothetical protein